MSMKHPSHPGDVVREICLAGAGLTVTDAAKALGVTRQALNNLVNRKSGVSPEMALRLEKAFGSAAETWLRMQSAYDLARVREKAGAIKVRRFEMAAKE